MASTSPAFVVQPLLPRHTSADNVVFPLSPQSASPASPACKMPSINPLPPPIPPPMTSKKRLHLLENTLLVNIVPLLWGTFGPVVKLIQTIPPAIPTPLVNVSTYFSALLTVTILLRFQRNTTPTPARAGMELGFYLYLGGLLNIQGLTLTSASRAAFFVQLSTVFTPLMDRFRGNLVPLRVFGAAGFAMAGTCILAMHSHVDAGHTYPKLFAAVNIGDVFCIGTAFFYSLYAVRLEALSITTGTPLGLVRSKTLTELLLSLLVVLFMHLSGDTTNSHYVSAMSQFSAHDLALTGVGLFWLGAATTVLATWAQVTGQRRVGASRAAVSYALQPLWAVLTAVGLGVDGAGGWELFGGALIMSAGLILAILDFGKDA